MPAEGGIGFASRARMRSPWRHLWFALAASAAILAMLAPIGLTPSAPPGPHWLFIVCALAAQRRPSAAVPPLVFAFGLAYEALRGGPVGAELIGLLVVTEGLAALARRAPLSGFVIAWARAALAALLLEASVWLLLAATRAPTPDWDILAARLALTILAYPALALLLERPWRSRSGAF